MKEIKAHRRNLEESVTQNSNSKLYNILGTGMAYGMGVSGVVAFHFLCPPIIICDAYYVIKNGPKKTYERIRDAFKTG
ncbi:hypothetical protein AYK26_06725 [Euryarchaeota archaeon SM23-78]|nr:MAG: hypothetical protein AYK26_06725 [Euryarchaeota archaeon SM23-78]MBW3001188.1 hypothetical protein [Candidatus Woesearchaeota archaeon]